MGRNLLKSQLNDIEPSPGMKIIHFFLHGVNVEAGGILEFSWLQHNSLEFVLSPQNWWQ